jgi:hypothetical protein
MACLVVDPMETDAPLVIDAVAILASSVAFQLLKPITRRSQQILKVIVIIEINQFPASSTLDILGQFGRHLTEKYFLCFVGCE